MSDYILSAENGYAPDPEQMMRQLMADFEKADKERERFKPRKYRSIARQLIAARQQKGLTQIQLAEKSGVAQAIIARIESGRANPTVTTLGRIARAVDRQVALIEV